MVGGEVLEDGGGEEVEGVSLFNLVGDVGIGEVGVAGAGDGDKEALVGDKRGRWGGDVAWFGDHYSANPKEVAYGGKVEQIRRCGAVEDIGLTGVKALICGARIACDCGLGMGLDMKEQEK